MFYNQKIELIAGGKTKSSFQSHTLFTESMLNLQPHSFPPSVSLVWELGSIPTELVSLHVRSQLKTVPKSFMLQRLAHIQ